MFWHGTGMRFSAAIVKQKGGLLFHSLPFAIFKVAASLVELVFGAIYFFSTQLFPFCSYPLALAFSFNQSINRTWVGVSSSGFPRHV